MKDFNRRFYLFLALIWIFGGTPHLAYSCETAYSCEPASPSESNKINKNITFAEPTVYTSFPLALSSPPKRAK